MLHLKMDIKLPFGIKDGQLVDIVDVDSGLTCDCKCPSCGHPLVAKKGEKNQHHFAHHNKPDCYGAVETALHIKGKEIIAKHKRIVLPPVFLAGRQLFDQTEVTFDKVELEKRTGHIVPDIVGYINGRPLLIEIAVTHFIDRQKAYKIQQLGLSAIEIDLAGLFKSSYKSFQLKDFETRLLDGVDYKQWINNEKLDKYDRQLEQLTQTKKVIHTNLDAYPIIVDNCPINIRTWKSGFKQGQSFASVFDDCWDCPHGQVIRDKKYFNDGGIVIDGKIMSVECNGHRQDDIDGLIKRIKKRTTTKHKGNGAGRLEKRRSTPIENWFTGDSFVS